MNRTTEGRDGLLERIRRGVEAHGPRHTSQPAQESPAEESVGQESRDDSSTDGAHIDSAHFDWERLLAHRFDGDQEPAQLEPAMEHLDSCAHCQRDAFAIDPTLLFRRLAPQHFATPNPAPADVETMKHDVATLRRARALSGEASENRDGRFPRWPLSEWPVTQWSRPRGRAFVRRSRSAAAIAAAMLLATALGFSGAQIWNPASEEAVETAALTTVGTTSAADAVGSGADGDELFQAPTLEAPGREPLTFDALLPSTVPPSPQRLGRLTPQARPAADGYWDDPVLEGTDRPHARVYSSGATPEEDIAVVMVIDSGFDV